MQPKFDADTGALAPRSVLNAANADVSLEDWWWSLLPRRSVKRVLDLGCGLGKQSFFVAGQIPGVEITALDISQDAVDAVNQRGRREGLSVTAKRLGFDECLGALDGQAFDLIVSAYAIYYASDVVGLIKGLARNLAPGGMAVIMGYGAGSNGEAVEITNRYAAAADRVAPVPDFLTPAQVDALRSAYGTVETARLDNRVAFRSAEEFMRWWTNHNSYRAAVADKVEAEVVAQVQRAGAFHLAKNVFAVLLRA